MSNYPKPLVSIDIVMLALIEGKLNFFTLKRVRNPFKGEFALPGGRVYVDQDQSLEDTVRRILRDKVNLDNPESIYFEQVHTFSGASRDPEGWSISVSYFTIVTDYLSINSSEPFKWVPVDENIKGSLPYDHVEIVNAAVSRVRSKSAYSSLACYFLPATFTWAGMQSVYEQVMGVSLQARSFRRRIEDMEVIQYTGATVVSEEKPNSRPSLELKLKDDSTFLKFNTKLQRTK